MTQVLLTAISTATFTCLLNYRFLQLCFDFQIQGLELLKMPASLEISIWPCCLL